MQNKSRTKYIAILVISYMLIALVWWSVLLFSKNNEAFNSQTLRFNEGNLTSEAYAQIEEKHARQKYMIIGEGLVFGIMLIIGIRLIVKSYSRELAVAQKENNFLLSITHELKSPIAAIQLILDTFKKRELPKETFDTLNTNALEETDRLNTLVGNLLYANKLSYGTSFHFEQRDLVQLLKNILLHFEKIHPQFDIQTDLRQSVYGKVDDDAFKIMISNILENAIKYSGESKEIMCRLSLENDKAVISIEDRGIGISDQEKKTIFEKFYRIGNEDTRETKGTGLGLYLCKEIVTAHKGDIVVKNNNPKGSIFRITIPAYDK